MSDYVKLTRDELYARILQTSASELAKEFHISDVALGKICRKMNVPKPPRGYWEKLRAGGTLPRSPLPAADNGVRDFAVFDIPKVVLVSDETQALIDREDLPENQVSIAESLNDPHPLVAKLKTDTDKTDPGPTEGIIVPSTGRGNLNITASRDQLSRALLLADALLRGLEERGYKVVVSSDSRSGEKTRVVKEGEEVFISFYEKS